MMIYRYSGKSGIQLPVISLGLWHNFGGVDIYENSRAMLCYAFNEGVTHFDLANNYGPPPGSAESTFGQVLKSDLAAHRDEMIISSKAGHEMWAGPYGDGSSRKNLMASIDQSLRRTGLDYFDIFYSHRYDGITPVEETMQALTDIVRQGKALYVGLSKYPPEKAKQALAILKENKTPCLIYQDRYSMLDRHIESEHHELISSEGAGFIAFSPLAQGLLTNKYLKGIPADSRAAKSTGYLQTDQVTPNIMEKVQSLNKIAERRGQSLAQLALAWTLRDERRSTSVIVGTSSLNQLKDNLATLNSLAFDQSELNDIENILRD